MANVGQIIYNVEDYNSSGGYISTNANATATIISSSFGSFEEFTSAAIDIFNSNLVTKVNGAVSFSKLGVQAPPGTRIVINTDKHIMIGRTGVYELDEDINVTSLYFERPKKYELDQDATQASLENGLAGLRAAELERKESIEALEQKGLSTEDYWEEYNKIQAIYNKEYQTALSLYNMGLNGVYTLPNSSDENAEENYEVLYNIIIDFIY